MIPVSNPYLRAMCTTLLVLSLLSITGCGGCIRKDDEAKTEEEKKEEERKKKLALPDFDSLPPLAMPGIQNDPAEVKRKRKKIKNDPIQKKIQQKLTRSRTRAFVKPGHWFDVRFQALANNFDINGTLRTTAISTRAQALPVVGTKFSTYTSRPISLAKGEWKMFETSMYLPPRGSSGQVATSGFLCEVMRPGGSFTGFLGQASSRTLQPHQHHMVVLTSNPGSYGFLDMAPTVRLPKSQFEAANRMPTAAYVVIPSTPKLPPPLPRESLNWTTIAYLVWDDLDPDELSPDQQQALVDWIHFGGQLILSAPDCLERLESSFLADYLPAQAGDAVGLGSEAIADINQNWSIPEKTLSGQTRDIVISDKTPIIGVEFVPHVDANFFQGTGNLVVERQLGRGRIVATSFSLKSPPIRSWRSFDSFLNGVLMRRPGRKFVETDMAGFRFQWQGDGAHMHEPLLHSSLRYLSRDLSSRLDTNDRTPEEIVKGRTQIEPDETINPGFMMVNPDPIQAAGPYRRDVKDTWHYGGYDANPISGVGGWSDRGPVAEAARLTLFDAAGIAPPSAGLVLKLLAAYLLILVPLNWAVFRTIGKVELAWVAAPIISIVGAFVVIKAASLDIGFSRSNTQVCVLELPTEYHRGHLTEYSALYTSLSTTYSVNMDNLGSQALPFPTGGAVSVSEYVPLRINQTSKKSLDGIQIQSNSTELLHAEHMIDVKGPLTMKTNDDGSIEVTNGTALNLQEVIVVTYDKETRKRNVGYLKTLAPDATGNFQFSPVDDFREFTRNIDVYLNPRQYAIHLWEEEFGNRDSVSFEMMLNMKVIGERKTEYQNWLLQENNDIELIQREVFIQVYEELNPTNRVTLGRVVDAIDQRLALEAGHYRLYAATDQSIGNTVFEPSSTQIDRQTLVVAHLTNPAFKVLGRDANSPADFAIESTLDRELNILNQEDAKDDGSSDSKEESEKASPAASNN